MFTKYEAYIPCIASSKQTDKRHGMTISPRVITCYLPAEVTELIIIVLILSDGFLSRLDPTVHHTQPETTTVGYYSMLTLNSTCGASNSGPAFMLAQKHI